MKRWKIFDRLRSFFKGEEGDNKAQLNNEPVLKSEKESQIIDENDRSMDLEDLDEEYRVLWEIVESRNRELTEQLAEKQNLLVQIVAGKWVGSAAMSIPWQEATTSAHATITISNDPESVTPPARDMGVDPISWDTTTMGNADTLPKYHADDNGFLEDNPCSKDTKDELISSPPNFLSMKRERVPSTPDSCYATICGTRILSANAVLEAKTASTPNLLGDQLSTTPRYSVCNSYFPGTKSFSSTSELLPN